jgi:site-specific recombinase XerD
MEKSGAPTRHDHPFHPPRKPYIERSLNQALHQGRVTPQDAQLIRSFTLEMQSARNISESRILKLTSTLVTWRRFIGPFAENTLPDLYVGIAALKDAKNARDIPFAQNTRRDFLTILKAFYSWMVENEFSSININKVKKIRAPSHDRMTKTAADLITPQDLQSMLIACDRSIDRALLMTLYEGGFRIGEIAGMRWGDLKFEDEGVIVNVNFKTGITRYVRLVMALEYLIKWKSDYPFEPAGEALVFINAHRNGYSYAMLVKKIQTIADRAGLNRRISPHLFRHSRITHMIQEGYPESVIKLMMWGNLETTEFATYLHLSGNDIDAAIFKQQGIITRKQPSDTPSLAPRQCPRCLTVNSPITRYCSGCGARLLAAGESSTSDVNRVLAEIPREVLVQHLATLLQTPSPRIHIDPNMSSFLHVQTRN